MKSPSREPRLPGVPRSESEDESSERTEQTASNAESFAEREKQAVAALGRRQELQSTLRGAPDTLKLGAQTWEPPAEPDDLVDTARLPPRWSPLEDDDDYDDVTDVTTGNPLTGAVVSETTPSVAGVIRSEDGPANITASVPGEPAGKATPVSVTVSPSAAVEMIEATTTPLRKISADEAATRKMPREAPAGFPPAPEVGDQTVLIDTGRGKRSSLPLVAIALMSVAAGLAAGFALWNRDSPAPAPAAASDPPTPPADREAAAIPAVTAPDAKPAPACKLAVRSEPSGAEVRIAGEVVGTTPIDLGRACGEVSLRLAKKRYQTSEQTVALTADTIGVVSVTLDRPKFDVTIRSRPRGATLSVNGKTIGKTPKTIKLAGFEKATIELERRGFRPYKKVITPKKRTRLRPKLRRK